jgi:hypothetical protein
MARQTNNGSPEHKDHVFIAYFLFVRLSPGLRPCGKFPNYTFSIIIISLLGCALADRDAGGLYSYVFARQKHKAKKWQGGYFLAARAAPAKTGAQG